MLLLVNCVMDLGLRATHLIGIGVPEVVYRPFICALHNFSFIDLSYVVGYKS